MDSNKNKEFGKKAVEFFYLLVIFVSLLTQSLPTAYD